MFYPLVWILECAFWTVVNAFEKKGVGGGTTKLLKIDTEAGMQLFFCKYKSECTLPYHKKSDITILNVG